MTDFGASVRNTFPPWTFAATGVGATTWGASKVLTLSTFGAVRVSPRAALAAIPKLLPEDVNQRRAAFTAIREVLSASGEIVGERASRLQRIAALFGVDASEGSETASNVAPFDPKAKAS